MSVFTQAEIDYLNDQMLGRLATATVDGKPHVVPVSFSYNADLDTIDIGGHGFGTRKKYRDVQRNPWVAFVVDDLVSTDPWWPRMLEVRGLATALPEGGTALGPGFADAMMRIRPARIISYGLGADHQTSVARSV